MAIGRGVRLRSRGIAESTEREAPGFAEADAPSDDFPVTFVAVVRTRGMVRLHRAILASGSALAAALVACSGAPTAPPAESSSGAAAGTVAPPSEPPPDTSSGASSSSGTTPPPPSTPTPAGWGKAACPSPSGAVGFEVGQPIADLGVKDCDTNAPATIDDLCGADATWIFVAHTHCPTCQGTASFTDEVATEVASKNVAIAHIVHDDNGTSCAKWKAAYKLAGFGNVKVYADPDGKVWSKLKTSNYTAPSAFLDKNRVVTLREHGLTKSEVLAEIDKALAKK